MRGIILAGGKATRLYPVTKGVCKQMLPLYDKPMIYYPLSVLMLAGIRDILVISSHEDIPRFQGLLGEGKDLGVNLSYATQKEPRGIAEAFIIGEKFIGKERVCLILGDNIFYSYNFTEILKEAASLEKGAAVFGYYVKDPQRYGVIEFDRNNNVISIEEKPVKAKSNWAVTGLYFYDNSVVEIAKKVKLSPRGELEISDINNEYLRKGELKVNQLSRGCAWLDTGTHDSLLDASLFIKIIEERQGLKIGCIEEVAYRMGYINKEQLEELSKGVSASYREYLIRIIQEEN